LGNLTAFARRKNLFGSSAARFGGIIRSDMCGILTAGLNDPPMARRAQVLGNVRAQSCACDFGQSGAGPPSASFAWRDKA
jgi:hypothetical protein